MKTRTIYWICQAAGWGTYVALGISSAVAQVGWTLSIVVGYGLFFFYSIALTDLLRREARRRNWLNKPLGLPRLFTSAVGLAAVQAFLVFAVDLILHGQISQYLSRPVFIVWLWMGVSGADCIWVLFYLAATSKRRVDEKEVRFQLALREAELRALESQLNPHFLFNCLNSVRALVVEDPPRAQEMITRLANILRYNLHRDLNHMVSLATELETASDYLALESIRFEDRLRVQLAIDPAAADILVPPMLLQTLIENALKHGIAHLPQGGDVTIRARCEQTQLVLEVENTGQLSPLSPESTQVGLRNIRDRLRILYGDGASLALVNRDATRVAATVLIPRTA